MNSTLIPEVRPVTVAWATTTVEEHTVTLPWWPVTLSGRTWMDLHGDERLLERAYRTVTAR